MKRYSFNIAEWQLSDFFSPIRTKKDSLTVLMKAMKVMLVNASVDESIVAGRIELVVSKMSRIFFFSQNKYYSINFPFYVSEDAGLLKFKFSDSLELDSMVTSEVLSVIADDAFSEAGCIYSFFDNIADSTERIMPEFSTLILRLCLYEDGYLRYDYDDRQPSTDIHPLNHYDVFYSASSTFKIGLNDRIKEEDMIDMIRSDSHCKFLS